MGRFLECDDTDRRQILLHYSPDGRALADEFFLPLMRNSDTAMDQFSPGELEVVRHYFAGAAMAAHRETMTPGDQRSDRRWRARSPDRCLTSLL